MNSKFQQLLVKKVLNNHQLKYVLRQYKDLSLSLNKNKQELLDEIDDEQAEHKFITRQISFDDYCIIKKKYTKEFFEIINKNHTKISKYNLMNLYKVQETSQHQRFEYLLLQKLSEHIGDMSLQEILSCLNNLKVYDKKVIKFQFDLLSERITEMTTTMTNEQLINIIYLFGKFDSGTEELWMELSKLFLFRIEDLSKEDILSVMKGYAGSNRGNQLFWNKVYSYFDKRCNGLIEQVDFDITWILMKVKIENKDFWTFVNVNYTTLLKQCKNHPLVFYKFLKYSIQNILNISQVNQIELFDILVQHKEQLGPQYEMKILRLLTKNNLMSPKISQAFYNKQTNFLQFDQKLIS